MTPKKSDQPLRPYTTQELRLSKPSRQDFHDLPRTPIHLVLDGVKSASNLGNIFRVGDALLVEKIWICRSTVNISGYKFRKAAKSMEKWVPYQQVQNTVGVVKALKDLGYVIVGVELTAHSVPYSEARVSEKMALIVGSETLGISPEVLELCDQVLVLPQLGLGNSVNVGTALAVVAYTLFCRGRNLSEHT